MEKITSDDIEKISKLWIEESEEEKEKEEKINETFKKLDRKHDVLYKFILSYTSYISSKQNYGYLDGELTMMEAHMLINIIDNPGITVTELSKEWKKTTSAVSQTIKKLIKKEFIYRKISEENAKFFYLYPSQKAKDYTRYHKYYDNIDIVKTIKVLNKKFSFEEIASFYEIMREYTKILEENR